MTKLNEKNIEFFGIIIIILNLYFSYVKYFYLSIFIPAFFGVLIILFSKAKKIKINKIVLPYMFIFLIFLISGIINFSSYSMSYIFKFLIGIFILLVFDNLNSNNRKKAIKLFKCFSLLFAHLTIILVYLPDLFVTISRFLFPDEIANNVIGLYAARCYSGIAGQTGNNAFLIMIGGIVILHELFFSEKQNVFIRIFNFIVLVFAILLTNKRLFLAIILILFFIFLFLFLKNKKLTKTKIEIIFIIIISLVLFAAFVIDNFKVFSRFSGTDFSTGRDKLAELALNAIKEHPIIGVGINNFIPYTNSKIYAHNVFLQIMSEIGIMAGLVVVLIFVNLLIKSLNKVRKIIKKDSNLCIIFSSLGQLIFVLYFFTGNSLYDTNMLYFYFICIGILFNYIRSDRNEKTEKNRNYNIS